MPRLVDVDEAVLTNLVRPAKLLRVHQPQQHQQKLKQATMPTLRRRAALSSKEKTLLDPTRHPTEPQLLPRTTTSCRTTSVMKTGVVLATLTRERCRAHDKSVVAALMTWDMLNALSVPILDPSDHETPTRSGARATASPRPHLHPHPLPHSRPWGRAQRALTRLTPVAA